MDRYWVISLAARPVRRGRRERSSQRRNGETKTKRRRVSPRGRDAPPAESNYIVFSVRPPLAPFLRCELRSLRNLPRPSTPASRQSIY